MTAQYLPVAACTSLNIRPSSIPLKLWALLPPFLFFTRDGALYAVVAGWIRFCFLALITTAVLIFVAAALYILITRPGYRLFNF